MRRIILCALLSLLGAGVVTASSPRRPVSTYSIVARDAATGQLGVAVQSHWFSVGTVVSWAEAGVGAVATQSFAEPAYGVRGLQLMASGLDAEESLAALLTVDEGRAVRQVAFIDAAGRVAAHTGASCIDAAGHQLGEGYSVQANMMRSTAVVPAMAAAYEAAHGDLAARLLAALEAAEAAGGDIRGRQSAAMLIVAGESSGREWADRVLELRVEDHPTPLAELARLINVHRAYEHMNRGDVAVEQGELAVAGAEYATAAELLPESLEVRYWHALTLATTGRVEEALPIFRRVFAADPQWVELTRRLVKPGIIADDEAGRQLLQTILATAP